MAFVALVVGCSASSSAPSSSAPTQPPTAPSGSAGGPGEWITYNGGNGRQGVGTSELAASSAPAASSASSSAPPAIAWRARLDGAVYGQPLLVGGRVLAATENDSVYALDASDGQVLWHTRVGDPQPLSGLPCGNIDPLGITSTMAYDPVGGSLFALAETDGGHHTLLALDPSTGAVRWRRSVEPPSGIPADTQQRAALTVAFGRVYVPFGGLDGDCGNYVGSVVGTSTSGQGAQVHYAVPTPLRGAIWAPGGLLTVGGTLYAAAGNGASTTGFDGSDSVIALSPELARLAYFAPATWAQDNADDLDLGSMTPALVGSRILALGKRGEAYLLAADRLGGVGGQIAQARVCPAFGSAAVRGATAYVACSDGIRAVDTTGDRIRVLWASAAPANGSPTLSGGDVWAVAWPTGTLYRFAASTGAVTGQVALGTVPHFASATVGKGLLYVGTTSGVTAVSG